jgi:hypothetical protein
LQLLRLCIVDHGDHGVAIKTRYGNFQDHLEDVLAKYPIP